MPLSTAVVPNVALLFDDEKLGNLEDEGGLELLLPAGNGRNTTSGGSIG
jgi:hypothetical protein